MQLKTPAELLAQLIEAGFAERAKSFLGCTEGYMPTLDRYKKMLAEWERMRREQQLSKAQIESILDAAEA